MSGRLQLPVSDIVRRLLVNIGLGTLPSAGGAWPINVNMELDTPDKTITIYDTQSTQEGRVQTSGENVEHYGIQIRVRAPLYHDGYDKADAIKHSIDTEVNNTVVTYNGNSYLVQSIMRTGGVLHITRDVSVSERELFTINASVNLRQL